MTVYQLPTDVMAKRFARNARSRGYVVKVAGRLVTVDRVDAQFVALVERYAGLRVNGRDRRGSLAVCPPY